MALFLREKHDVTVLERSTRQSSNDSADDDDRDNVLVVYANSLNLLMRMGFNLSALHAVTVAKMWTLSTHAHVLNVDTNVDSRAHRADRLPSVLTSRLRIHDELKRLALDPNGPGKPVEIVYQQRIASVDTFNGIITSRSGETFQGDIVIGESPAAAGAGARRTRLACRRPACRR